MKRYITMTALAASILISCDGGFSAPDLPESPGTKEVEIIISGGGGASALSKSRVTAPEDGIRSADIFIYLDGYLDNELSQHLTFSDDGVSSCSRTVWLELGKTYEILALVNSGIREAPAELAEAILSLKYTVSGINEWNLRGLPMAARKRISVTTASTSLELQLVRLVSKVNFTLHTSGLQHGSINFRSIKVRQMNTCCPFFLDGKAEGSVCDGDLASVEELAGINASPQGYTASFYILENLQGDILSGNTDPDAKNPDSVAAAGGDPGNCTYLELVGSYSDNSGYLKGEALTARMFIGSDACSNFDVVRNYQYNIDLTITDEGCLRTDWKIDGNLDDGRILYFSPESSTITAGTSETVILNTNLSLEAGDFTYTISGDATYCFRVQVNSTGTEYKINCHTGAPTGAILKITATTWDGKITAQFNALAYQPHF